MCGICGKYIFHSDEQVKRQLIKDMCATLRNRGPDDSGMWLSKNKKIGLGHTRLSIIDVSSAGHQPMSNEDDSIWISYNGEFYNYLDYRDDLINNGHQFQSKTDTEVIIHLYEDYGLEFLNKINGMFALSLWDEKEKKLILARDRLGIKPIYYYLDADKVVWASDLQSIRMDPTVPKEIDYQALDEFLTYRYIPAPRTIYKKIKKIPAGHMLIFCKGNHNLVKYWALDENVQYIKEKYGDLLLDENWVSNHLSDLLMNSVKCRLMSDVPLGAFLSGGMDSSSIVAFMSKVLNKPVKTFTIGFSEESYSELKYAKAVSNHAHTEHREYIMLPKIDDLLESTIPQFGEPFSDVSLIPVYMVSKFAREHVKVVLSGDGGDELFGGYDWYLADNLSTIYSNIPPRIRDVLSKLLSLIPYSRRKKGLINMLKKFQSGFEYPDHLGHLRWNMYSSIADKKSIYTDELYGHLKGIEPYDAVNLHIKKVQSMNRSYRNMYVDLKTWIPDDILLKTDKMSMAVSLEARVPMMDHELVEFSMAIPPSLKIKGKKTKMILKTAMKDFLPDQIINRKDKLGFSIPLKEWLRNKSNDHLMSYLSEESLKAHGLFNYKHITKLIQDHQMRKVDNSQKLFSLLAFEIWRNHCYK